MADVNPFFSFFIVYTLTDVIIKVTVPDLITTFLADVIAICVWDGNTTHNTCYDLILTTIADVIANLFLWQMVKPLYLPVIVG